MFWSCLVGVLVVFGVVLVVLRWCFGEYLVVFFVLLQLCYGGVWWWFSGVLVVL